jgi:magnesium transporter
MPTLDINEIKQIIEEGKTDKLRKKIADTEIPELAVAIDQLTERYKLKFYLSIPTTRSSDVLLEVSKHSRKFILKSLKDKYIISMIKGIESDDSADILGEVPEHKAKRIFANLPLEQKEAIRPLIKYEEDTAGGIMQSELVAL